VKVENPKNGRSVRVRINDCGPCVLGRSLDLSLRAAQQIGITRQRVARVTITTLKLPPDATVERIGPQEAKRLVDQDAAVMLDLSMQPEGQKIKGAVRANPNDLTGWLTVVPRGKDVITYCT